MNSRLCEKIIFLIQCKKNSNQICNELNISKKELLKGLKLIRESGTPLQFTNNGNIITYGFPRRVKDSFDISLSKDYLKLLFLGDTHLGSVYDDVVSLMYAYDLAEEKGVDMVFHCGDFVDGIVSTPDYFSELKETTYQGQLEYAIDKYPRYSGKTFVVSGNHDDYWHVLTGREIISDISDKRDDIIYLSSSRRFVNIDTLKLNILHGRFMKNNRINDIYSYVNNMYYEKRPHIIHSGHYHTSEHALYKNVLMLRSGAFMKECPHNIKRGLKSDDGLYYVEVYFDDNGEVGKIYRKREVISKRLVKR